VATTAASEATPWRAGAASVLSSSGVGAAVAARSAPPVAASSGSGVEGVNGTSAIVGVAVGTGFGQLPFVTPHDVD
jgi:hypothetical protein